MIFNILITALIAMMIFGFSFHAIVWGRFMRIDKSLYEREGRPFVLQFNYWNKFYKKGKYELLTDIPSKKLARIIAGLLTLDRKVLIYSIPLLFLFFAWVAFKYGSIT